MPLTDEQITSTAACIRRRPFITRLRVLFKARDYCDDVCPGCCTPSQLAEATNARLFGSRRLGVPASTVGELKEFVRAGDRYRRILNGEDVEDDDSESIDGEGTVNRVAKAIAELLDPRLDPATITVVLGFLAQIFQMIHAKNNPPADGE